MPYSCVCITRVFLDLVLQIDLVEQVDAIIDKSVITEYSFIKLSSLSFSLAQRGLLLWQKYMARSVLH